VRKLAVIACSLDQKGLADRRERWLRLWARAGVDIIPTDSGLQLRFEHTPGVEQELGRLAALERQCCGFADWSVYRADELVMLEVSADSVEGVAAVHVMFEATAFTAPA
jgi:hypothetical protein